MFTKKYLLTTLLVVLNLLILPILTYSIWAANHIWDISFPGQERKGYILESITQEEVDRFCQLQTMHTRDYPIKVQLEGSTVRCTLESRAFIRSQDVHRYPKFTFKVFGKTFSIGKADEEYYYSKDPGIYSFTFEDAEICNTLYDYHKFDIETDYENMRCVDSYPTWRR